MASDRARISFDHTREYRSVVAQQGRVTLEADVNEQVTIASEALRLETIDVVGPAGTPDNGYEIKWVNGGLVASAGTMYVGGWQLHSDEVALSKQPEWLDQPTTTNAPAPAVVGLLATEQFISATEDQALREVALGGPDTAARSRLMQHLIEIQTSQSTCLQAEADIQKRLLGMGFLWNRKTAELTFEARLQVSFFTPPPQSDACCPSAQGGYLGSDNQLVQVTVTQFDPNTKEGTLLWGWNDASFLYRASLVNPKAEPQILQLGQTPLDAEHTPQPNQAIEVLCTTMVLGDAKDQNYIAAPQGQVITLGSGTIFDPTSSQLTLPAGTKLQADINMLFVRLWQAQVPFQVGKVTALDDASGLAVKVEINALPTSPFVTRPFWQFAVRPNTPQQVYPQRYLEAPQLPDGPRQWLTDLAVITPGGQEGQPPLIHSCLPPFKPLTKAESCTCCNLALAPDEDWQTKLSDALASNATAVSVCFSAGTFEVSNKITIPSTPDKSVKSVKMTGAGAGTVDGAGAGTVITGGSLEVVIEFDNCLSVGLSDLSVRAGVAGYPAMAPGLHGLQGAVTISNCRQVDIERVSLACADADLRAASCLTVYNDEPASGTPPQQYNVRVLNSQFRPGHCQVGILMVNADRAQVEGNLIVTQSESLNIGNFASLSKRPAIVQRLRKQLMHALTIVDTAPLSTKKAQKRLRREQKKTASAGGLQTETKQSAGSTVAKETTVANPTRESIPLTPVNRPKLNLGSVGRARVAATFGTFHLEFISNDKLGNAWNDALKNSGLTASSSMGDIHRFVKKLAGNILAKPEQAAPTFRNFIEAILPQLYSTSSQGIVIGGKVANDIRILNNTIDGTAQGIHVGLSDQKAVPHVSHYLAERVQICGNSVNIRLTPEVTGNRHGIFLGCAKSAIINDNHLELTRSSNAGQDIFAIVVEGYYGPRLLIERNCMLNFTNGIVVETDAQSLPTNQKTKTPTVLWKASDNASSSPNFLSYFETTDNIP